MEPIYTSHPPLVDEGLAVDITTAVHFAFDSARLSGEARSALDSAYTHADARDPGYGMGKLGVITAAEAVGHTDSIDTRAYNDRLGLRRATAAGDYLAGLGVAPGRIYVSSQGEDTPVASNRRASGRAANRRADVILHTLHVR